MEKSIVVADDRPRSLIKINSISIDLLEANNNEDAEKCEHFSIRGYVSQIRKRSKKICWPFPIDGNDNQSEGAPCLLPPLDVPKFRWWRCKNCLQEIVTGGAIKDNELVSYPCRCGFKSKGTCSHASSPGATALPLDFQQPPKPFFIEGGKFDASTYMANNKDLPLSHSIEKERESEVAYNTLTAKVNPCMTKEKQTNGIVTSKSKWSGSVGVFKGATIVGKEPNNASSDSDEIKSRGAPRRKFRKVRLLAELLGENGVARTNCIKRTSGSSPNAVSDPSLRQGTVSILQGPVAVQGGNVRRSFMGQNRKRKPPRDEEWIPPATSSLNNVNKTVTDSEDAETESDEDAVVGADLQDRLNCSSTKHKVDKDSTLGKRTNKKTQVIDLNKSQCETGDISEGDGINDAWISSAQDTFSNRGTDPFPPRAQKMKRKSNWWESNGKIPHVDDGLASVVPSHDAAPIAGPTAGKNVEVMRTETLTVPIQSVQQASTGRRLDLSFDNYLSVPRYDKLYSPQAEGGWPSSLHWQEGTNQGMRKGIETNYIGNSRVLAKSAVNGVYGNGVNVDLRRREIIYKLPLLNDKHKHSSQFADGAGSLMQQMPFSKPSYNERTIEDQERLSATKMHTSRRTDKVSELGTLDDIPMEIVELMAKNQYERCLHDAERGKHPSETMNNRSPQILDFTGGYGNREFRPLQDEVTRKQKPLAKNGRDGIIIAGDNMGIGPTKHKLHENPNSEPHFHAASSSGHNNPQNCLWTGDRAKLGIRSYNSSTMQPLSACNTCQSRPQQSKEAAGHWPSTIPNHTPFGFNISQKCDAQPTNVDLLSRRPSSTHKRNMNGDHTMKFMNANAANHGQHQKNLGSDILSRSHLEYPFSCKHSTELPKLPKKIMGSLDLYSNETIPAMHLLSLMDAGIRSGTSITTEESQKLLKKSMFPQDHHSQEFPAQQHGVPHEYFPAIQMGMGGTSTSVQQNRSFQKVTDFTGQVSPKYPAKGKTKIQEFPSQNGSHKSFLPCVGSGRNRGVVSRFSSEQRYLGDSHSPSFLLQSHVFGNAAGKQKIDARVTNHDVWPLKSNMETAICSINRNPADFSVPGAKNGYMIRGEDLKFRKRVPTDGGSANNKRQKNVKLAAAKERARPRIPREFCQEQ